MTRKSWLNPLVCGAIVAAVAVAASSAPAQQRQQDPNLPQRAQDYASDQAKYQAAKRHYDDCAAQIVAARQSAGQEYRNSPEYIAAEKAVDDAFHAYNARKKQATAGARENDPRYIELTKQVAAVDAQLAAARKDPGTPYQQFTDLYNQKATYTKQLKALDDQVIAQSGADDVKRVWDAASAQLQKLQANQRQAVERAPQVLEALAAASQAKAQMDDIGVALAGSRAAYGQAADIQNQQDEYLRRYPYSNYDPYSWYGNYGWGFYGASSGWPVVVGHSSDIR